MTFTPPDFLLKTEELCKKLSIILGRNVQYSYGEHNRHLGHSVHIYFNIDIECDYFPIWIEYSATHKTVDEAHIHLNKKVEQRFKDAGL